ncbi:hypothetical protein CNX65_25540 [Actinosynnema pretiosum]|uniref:Serine/threonine protein kinase n=1 Tax=Actinosynnema pretiosum TaxID=42197 RepID=A0A290ZB11_9PSEU|nr:hypothetical protein CNX65_25540 [Actinosynnema pretiosum]
MVMAGAVVVGGALMALPALASGSGQGSGQGGGLAPATSAPATSPVGTSPQATTWSPPVQVTPEPSSGPGVTLTEPPVPETSPQATTHPDQRGN